MTLKCCFVFLDKYRIREVVPPKEANVILAEKKIQPFKHVRGYLFKIVHERMYCFVRLVDFIAMDMLRTLVNTAVELLLKQIEASATCAVQPFLNGVSENVDKVLGISEEKHAVPLFETTMKLQTLGNILATFCLFCSRFSLQIYCKLLIFQTFTEPK